MFLFWVCLLFDILLRAQRLPQQYTLSGFPIAASLCRGLVVVHTEESRTSPSLLYAWREWWGLELTSPSWSAARRGRNPAAVWRPANPSFTWRMNSVNTFYYCRANNLRHSAVEWNSPWSASRVVSHISITSGRTHPWDQCLKTTGRTGELAELGK